MKRLVLCTLLLCILAPALSHAQIVFGDTTTLAFATVEEAREILTSRDDFVWRMSPFDRAARLKTDRDVSEEEYLQFVSDNVRAWTDIEKRKVTSAFESIQTGLEALFVPFPKKIFLIKTTGNEEGGAAYTRANAIVLPESNLAGSVEDMKGLICHELFHVFSRENAELREMLYRVIGFAKCPEINFPEALRSRKITNPDAPKNDHFIMLTVENRTYPAVPILISATEKYNVRRGGEFFNYLQFQFLLMQSHDSSIYLEPIYEDGKPKLVGMKQVSGFYEQVGENTEYIIHPEEILADNFKLLVLGETDVPSPGILGGMRVAFEYARSPD